MLQRNPQLIKSVKSNIKITVEAKDTKRRAQQETLYWIYSVVSSCNPTLELQASRAHRMCVQKHWTALEGLVFMFLLLFVPFSGIFTVILI